MVKLSIRKGPISFHCCPIWVTGEEVLYPLTRTLGINLFQVQICPSSSLLSQEPFPISSTCCATKIQDKPGPFLALSPRALPGGSHQQQVDRRKGYY